MDTGRLADRTVAVEFVVGSCHEATVHGPYTDILRHGEMVETRIRSIVVRFDPMSQRAVRFSRYPLRPNVAGRVVWDGAVDAADCCPTRAVRVLLFNEGKLGEMALIERASLHRKSDADF